jgi:hypothetical protein
MIILARLPPVKATDFRLCTSIMAPGIYEADSSCRDLDQPGNHGGARGIRVADIYGSSSAGRTLQRSFRPGNDTDMSHRTFRMPGFRGPASRTQHQREDFRFSSPLGVKAATESALFHRRSRDGPDWARGRPLEAGLTL